MLRRTMMVLATAATFTAVLTADAVARGFGGGFAGGGFRASDHQVCNSAHPRGTLCAFPAAAQPLWCALVQRL
jgi:hypothetical protein